MSPVDVRQMLAEARGVRRSPFHTFLLLSCRSWGPSTAVTLSLHLRPVQTGWGRSCGREQPAQSLLALQVADQGHVAVPGCHGLPRTGHAVWRVGTPQAGSVPPCDACRLWRAGCRQSGLSPRRASPGPSVRLWSGEVLPTTCVLSRSVVLMCVMVTGDGREFIPSDGSQCPVRPAPAPSGGAVC